MLCDKSFQLVIVVIEPLESSLLHVSFSSDLGKFLSSPHIFVFFFFVSLDESQHTQTKVIDFRIKVALKVLPHMIDTLML